MASIFRHGPVDPKSQSGTLRSDPHCASTLSVVDSVRASLCERLILLGLSKADAEALSLEGASQLQVGKESLELEAAMDTYARTIARSWWRGFNQRDGHAWDALARHIDALDEADQTLLSLRFQLGLGFHEIAARMNSDVGSVRYRVSHLVEVVRRNEEVRGAFGW